MSMQLALPLDGDVRPRPLLRSPQQEQAFQAVLADLRSEAQRMLTAAIEISGVEYPKLSEVPTPLLKAARERVDGPQVIPLPTAPVRTDCIPEKPYKQWSDRRKYGERVRRLMLRVRKSTTFWYMEDLQSAVLENPEYFGICPLPSETACVLKPDQCIRKARKAAAIARENRFRTGVAS